MYGKARALMVYRAAPQYNGVIINNSLCGYMAPSIRESRSALQACFPQTRDAGSKSPILIDDLLGVDLWHGRFVARALTRLFGKSDPRFRWVPRGGSGAEGCGGSPAARAKA